MNKQMEQIGKTLLFETSVRKVVELQRIPVYDETVSDRDCDDLKIVTAQGVRRPPTAAGDEVRGVIRGGLQLLVEFQDCKCCVEWLAQLVEQTTSAS